MTAVYWWCPESGRLVAPEEEREEGTAEYVKAWGLHIGTRERLRKYHGMGAQLLAHGSEWAAIKGMLDASAKDFDVVVG